MKERKRKRGGGGEKKDEEEEREGGEEEGRSALRECRGMWEQVVSADMKSSGDKCCRAAGQQQKASE